MKTYTLKTYKGQLPGEQCTQWWTDEEWRDYERRVQELKDSGEYGKHLEYTITIQECEEFSTFKASSGNTYSFKLLDFSL